MSIEAMKQALEALEQYHGYMEPLTTVFGGPRVPAEQSTTGKVEKAITSLRQAIEQAEKQEPVAWIDDYNACKCPDNEARCFTDKVFRMMQKYTSPQPQKPLTDELLEEMAKKHVTNCYFDTLKYARAIEAAHGIKENT